MAKAANKTRNISRVMRWSKICSRDGDFNSHTIVSILVEEVSGIIRYLRNAMAVVC